MLKKINMMLGVALVVAFCVTMMPQKVEGANLAVIAIHPKHKWEKGSVAECGSAWKEFTLWGSRGGKTFWGIRKGNHRAYASMKCGGYNSGSIYLPSNWSWREIILYP